MELDLSCIGELLSFNDFLVNTFSDKPVKNLYRVFSPTWVGCRVHKSNAPTVLLQRRGGGGVKLV